MHKMDRIVDAFGPPEWRIWQVRMAMGHAIPCILSINVENMHGLQLCHGRSQE
jgi:hypothetical protein